MESKITTHNTKKTIWVQFQKEGIHRYPAALTDPALAEVKFLGYDHRHIFWFKVELEVFHDDRDIEFILLRRELESLYDQGTLQLDYKSCEMMCDDLATYLARVYPGRDMTVTVSEDNENGATSVYTAKVKYDRVRAWVFDQLENSEKDSTQVEEDFVESFGEQYLNMYHKAVEEYL